MEQPILLFGWFRWDILVEYKDLFWQGAWMTLRMTVVCVLLGSSWGLASHSRGWRTRAMRRGPGSRASSCAGRPRCT